MNQMSFIPASAADAEPNNKPRPGRWLFMTAVALLLTSAGGGAGYWVAKNEAGFSLDIPVLSQWLGDPQQLTTPVEGEGPVIYYRHPDGLPAYSAGPQKTQDGREFVAVHASQDINFDPQPEKAAVSDAKKILFYRNPMGLPDTSPEPKKDWMGMDYIPVYEGEEEDGNTVRISLGKVQRSGVRTEPAVMRQLSRPIRAPGVAKPDERALYSVSLRADGFIETLFANETGKLVRKGEPLFKVYSPEMVKVQVDYRIAGKERSAQAGALQRLRNLQIPQQIIETLQRTKEPVVSIDWPAPATGIVLRRKAIEGMMMRAGEEMLMLSDLSSVWVIADVAEQDLSGILTGSTAKVTFRAYPNETFAGRVTFIQNELEMSSRTAKVRVEIDNLDHRIKYEMFADVEFNAGSADADRLVVPDSALIDSGNRQVVLVELGEGRFDPRPVKVGLRGDGYVEIVEGIAPGENVVVSANFLIDAESNLKAALSSFTSGDDSEAGSTSDGKEEAKQ
ncbi:efflux RND transporter periplasmic adaptor subunit [Hoeflea sp. BAL378]|uniref:efflux RND transporter periplasmic adaptor subunit n=1 Tax=Hoeflea sp. BAL378 TaxID=1547437 RepID=UPI000B169839|nr:efflux RND transporter periplasmic adaptor subunit [Hoeflea sp. BAL378]